MSGRGVQATRNPSTEPRPTQPHALSGLCRNKRSSWSAHSSPANSEILACILADPVLQLNDHILNAAAELGGGVGKRRTKALTEIPQALANSTEA